MHGRYRGTFNQGFLLLAQSMFQQKKLQIRNNVNFVSRSRKLFFENVEKVLVSPVSGQKSTLLQFTPFACSNFNIWKIFDLD